LFLAPGFVRLLAPHVGGDLQPQLDDSAGVGHRPEGIADGEVHHLPPQRLELR
jgi:hypothetical protein